MINYSFLRDEVRKEGIKPTIAAEYYFGDREALGKIKLKYHTARETFDVTIQFFPIQFLILCQKNVWMESGDPTRSCGRKKKEKEKERMFPRSFRDTGIDTEQ